MAILIRRPNRKVAIEQGQFGEALQQALEKKGIAIQQFSEEIEVTYEHVRRLIKSMAFPSKPLMGRICQVLGLNKEEMRVKVISDRLKHKYGDVPQSLYGQNPKLERTNRNLLKLNDEQFDMVARMIESIARNGGGGRA